VLALLLVAVALGMSNLAAAIAIGLTGVDTRLRLRMALAFGLFEAGMPIIGLLIGRRAASAFGSHADLIAGCVVIATGVYSLLGSQRDEGQLPTSAGPPMGRLLITGFALSIDNLLVGFALGAYKVSFVVAAVVIGVVSVAMSLAGLELGARLGERVERSSDLLGGAILVVVGVAIAAGSL
jgi:manganese efflux pump family protein